MKMYLQRENKEEEENQQSQDLHFFFNKWLLLFSLHINFACTLLYVKSLRAYSVQEFLWGWCISHHATLPNGCPFKSNLALRITPSLYYSTVTFTLDIATHSWYMKLCVGKIHYSTGGNFQESGSNRLLKLFQIIISLLSFHPIHF